MMRQAWIRGALMSLSVSLLCACSGPSDRPAAGSAKEQARKKVSEATASIGPDSTEKWYRDRGQLLVECMRKAGFTFVPPAAPATRQKALGLSDEQFVKEYGFGISTLIDMQAPSDQDPNADNLASMSSGSQQQWQGAAGICEKQAVQQFGRSPNELSLNSAQAAELDKVNASAETDIRVVQAKEAYAECMAQNGYRVSRGEELTEALNNRAQSFIAAFDQGLVQLAQQGKDTSRVRAQDVLTASQLADLHKLQHDELTAASVDHQCGMLLYPVVKAVHKQYLDKFLNGG